MSEEGVTFVRIGLDDERLSTQRKTATIALYEGMEVSELQQVVKGALALPQLTLCIGFLVVSYERATVDDNDDATVEDDEDEEEYERREYVRSTRRRQKKMERIVPFSVACVSPNTLTTRTGYVKLLTKYTSVDRSFSHPQETVTREPKSDAASTPVSQDTIERIQRLISALQLETTPLGPFEAALMLEICMARAGDILLRMQNPDQSVQDKRQYLLSLVQDHTETATVKSSTKRQSTPPTSSSHSSLQVDLICKKIVSIAHTVFSPQVQSDLMTEASLYRQLPRRRSSHGQTTSTTTTSNIMELLSIVERLLNKHALEEEQSVSLIRMILTEHRMVMSALASYQLDCNLHELEETMKRMATLGNPKIKSSKSNRRTTTKNSRSGIPKHRVSPRKKINRKDPIEILDQLYQNEMITTLEFELLHELITQGDGPVLKLMQKYSQSHQIHILRDHLVGIVREITEDIKTMDDFQNPDDSGFLLDHWHEHLIQFVQYYGSPDQRVLLPEHVQILRRLIEDDHHLLQSAYEVYATDGDELELLDTLQRIAALTIQAQEQSELQAFSRTVDEQCAHLDSSEKNMVKQLFARKNELVRAAWEVFNVEQNPEELNETLLRIIRFTTRYDGNKQTLITVIGDLLQEQLILSHQADGLLQWLEGKHEAMIAAYEAFQVDHDVEELRETLLLIVKHAPFGDIPQCSSPRRQVLTSETLEESQLTRLIHSLLQIGRIVTWQADLLGSLIDDSRLLAIVDLYRQDRNISELVESLEHLCEIVVWQTHASKLLEEWIPALEQQGMIQSGVFESLVQSQDDRLMAALLVFAEDGDQNELNDTLIRLAHVVKDKPE